jgi:hypothetical protein
MMNEETVRKRKAQAADSEGLSDSVETPTTAGTGLAPVTNTRTPGTPLDLFLATFPAKPAGTLVAWKKYPDEVKVITEFLKAVLEADCDCDAVFNKLTDEYLNKQFGGLGLDFTKLKKRLKDNDKLRDSHPTAWIRCIHSCVVLSCEPIGSVYDKLKEIREQ